MHNIKKKSTPAVSSRSDPNYGINWDDILAFYPAISTRPNIIIITRSEDSVI